MWANLFIIVATFIGVGVGCTSEETPVPAAPANVSSAMERGARISFAELEYDFGEVIQGDKAQHTFHFKNTGTAELEVISVHRS